MLPADFQQNLFQILDKAARGEPSFIEYNGISFRLQAVGGASKGARAMKRETLRSDHQAINSSDKDLMAHLKAKWDAESNKR